jgi:catechol 2,3-dioxygenase-like lactoylglutathione lyase family enzyme
MEPVDVATVDHVGLTVTNLDASIAWYQAVFGLSVVQGPHVTAVLKSGSAISSGPA